MSNPGDIMPISLQEMYVNCCGSFCFVFFSVSDHQCSAEIVGILVICSMSIGSLAISNAGVRELFAATLGLRE
jgi:hypothetical protein